MQTQSGVKRLYKSRTDRMIDGVCGGVAAYFNVDPTLVRIAWVILTLLGGCGIILYIAAMIIMPKEPYSFAQASPATATPPGSTHTSNAETSKKNNLLWGMILICIGVLLFLNNMGFRLWHHWWLFDWDFTLSVVLILAGVAFLWGGRNSLSKTQPDVQPPSDQSEPAPSSTADRKLYRSLNDSKLFGVCGGLAEYFEVDSTIMRVLFVGGAFASGGLVVLAYIAMAIVVPKNYASFKMT